MGKAKRELRRALAREQRVIERRLAEAVAPNAGGPVLGRARIAYEHSERTRGVAHGGMGMVARLVAEVGLAAEIDASVHLLAQHLPYHESDHVLNIAYNLLAGGTAWSTSRSAATTRSTSTPSGPSASPTRPPPGTSAAASPRPTSSR